jgi:pilus assembly protein CpaB
MRNKSLFLLVACVCGTIAAIGVSQWMQAQDKGPGSGETIEIFVAAIDIEKAEEITAEKVRLEQWPIGKEPAGATNDVEAVLGKYAKTTFYAGEAVMPIKLTESNYKVIPKGYSVVAIKASEVDIANVINPGDRVNVLAYFNKSELIPRSMTKTVLMGVRVYALDGDTESKVGEDRPKSVRTIQLLIHKNDAEAWTYANELGKIRLAVGNDDDYAISTAEDGSNVAGKEFLEWLDEYQREQEEALRRKMQPEPQPDRSVATNVRNRDGFEIIKYVEGRQIKYWIEPGKLPVVIEDTGPESSSSDSAPSATPIGPNDQGISATDDRDEDYSFLNGEESPFFQPPGNDDGSDTEF